jgi:phospholipase D1/2
MRPIANGRRENGWRRSRPAACGVSGTDIIRPARASTRRWCSSMATRHSSAASISATTDGTSDCICRKTLGERTFAVVFVARTTTCNASCEAPSWRHLVSLFEDRWERAGGEPVTLRPLPIPTQPSPLTDAIALPMRSVGVARTRPRDPLDGRAPIRELEAMSVRAIERAEHLIYVETQYLTAHCIVEALLRRMRCASRGALEIVLMLPRCTEGALERAAIAAPQALALRMLGQAAAARGHAMAAFCSCAVPTRDRPEDDTPVTYIHSKLSIVDDVFLTIGSANMTNRSMRLDSELNLAWVAEGPSERESLRKLRASLLAEHTGLSDDAALALLECEHRVMPRLVQLANMGESRLIGHTSSALRDELGPLDEILVELGDPSDG